MDWFRWHHGTVTDPKFRYISVKTTQPVAHVLAVWACILERASENFGCCCGIDLECIDVLLGMDDGSALQIYQAMQLKGMISDDDTVTSWTKRQPKYEDPTASDRKRAQRERDKAQNVTENNEPSQTVTQCHGMSQHVTTEEKRIEETLKPFADDSASAAPAHPFDIAKPAASPRSPRKTKPKKAPTSQHAWFTRWWCWAVPHITGSSYLYAEKDAGALATMLKRCGIEATVDRAAAYLAIPDEQRFPRGSPTITGLLSQFNQLAGNTAGLDKLKRSGLLPDNGNISAFHPWDEGTAT
jgi:hypothetical protein